MNDKSNPTKDASPSRSLWTWLLVAQPLLWGISTGMCSFWHDLHRQEARIRIAGCELRRSASSTNMVVCLGNNASAWAPTRETDIVGLQTGPSPLYGLGARSCPIGTRWGTQLAERPNSHSDAIMLPTCRPYRPWPDALEKDVMLQGGDGRPTAQRSSRKSVDLLACGRWQQAVAEDAPTEVLSLRDSSAHARRVANQIDETIKASLGQPPVGPVGKFVDACVRAGVERRDDAPAAERRLHDRLEREASRFANDSSLTDFARAGTMAAAACPSPLRVESLLRPDGYSFVVRASARMLAAQYDATRLSAQQVLALRAWEEDALPASQEDAAKESADAMTDSADAADMRLAENEALVGAALYAWADDVQLPRSRARRALLLPHAKGTVRALRYGVPSEVWDAYVSLCIQALLSVRPTSAERAGQGNAAIGRIAPPPPLSAWDDDGAARRSKPLLELSRLVADGRRHDADADADGGVARCLGTARAFYADEFDGFAFQAVVGRSAGLYARLEPLVEGLRRATAEVVAENPGGVLLRADMASEAVAATRLRVVGAPAGTWATAFPESSRSLTPRMSAHTSKDGPTQILLHRSALVVTQQLWLAQRRADPCDHPPLWEALATNAYHLHPFRCVVLFPGILRRPFADAMYDERSFNNRIGAVIAHELAHAVDHFAEHTSKAALLSAAYPQSSVHTEAMADLIASLAVLRTGVSSARRFAMDWAQLWCGRPRSRFARAHDASWSHPSPNERSASLCAILPRVSNHSCDAQ